MADQLGEASLRIEVDIEALRASLNQAKTLVEKELGGTIGRQSQRAAAGARPPGGGGGGITAEQKAASTILKLRNSINVLEARGASVSQLRARLADVEAAAADRQFKAVNQQGEALRQIISTEQNRLRVSDILTSNFRKQVALSEKQSAAAVALNKQRDEAFRKSVKQSQAEAKFAAAYGPQLPGAPRRAAGTQANSAEAAEKRLAAQREKTARATEKAAAREAAAEARRLKDAQRRRDDIISNALIGGAFPALFGQGIGASIGGALGGGLGGARGGQFGFGLSLIGTALGAQFDIALQKAQTLAQGLDNPIKNFDALRQAALLSSRALEKQVEALIASGRSTEAEILLRKDLNTIFGDATAAEEYRNNVDALNRAWSQATVLLANFTSGPLTSFFRLIAQNLQAGPLREQVTRARASLTPQQQQRLESFTAQRRRELGLSDFAIDREKIQLYLDQLAEIDKITGQTAKTEQELLAVRTAAFKAQQAESRAVVQRAFGVEDLAASSEVQALRQRQNSLVAGFTGLSPEQQEAALQRLKKSGEDGAATAARIVDLRNQEITAAARLLQLDEQRQQRTEEVFRNISNTTQLLSVQPGIYRDNLKFIQQINESLLRASDTQEINLRNLDVARASLGEPTQANAADRERLIERERQVRLEYVDAAAQVRLSLIEAAERLRDSFRDAALRFTEIRGSAQGLNRFLTPEQREGRALANFDILLPLFRQAQKRFTELTGAQAPELVAGTQEDLNAGIRDFINAVNREEEAGRTLIDTQKALRDVNQNLLSVNERLISATQTLADKNWVVDVQVVNQAGGATTVNAINALSQ